MTEEEFRNGRENRRKEAELQDIVDKVSDDAVNIGRGVFYFDDFNKDSIKKPVCQEAEDTILKRGAVYGTVLENFTNIAALWDVAFGHKMNDMFTASDVAQAMRLVKEARLINDPGNRDSLVDICGYAQCQNEVNNGELVDEEA